MQASLEHLRDNFYTLAGLGCISAAAFVHSVFAGLITTGLLTLVFEWRTQKEDT